VKGLDRVVVKSSAGGQRKHPGKGEKVGGERREIRGEKSEQSLEKGCRAALVVRVGGGLRS